MKKLMFTAAMAAALAATAEIESANTVGYSDVSVAAGKFIIIGTQFTQVGAVNIPMSELIQGDFAPGTYSTRTTAAVNMSFFIFFFLFRAVAQERDPPFFALGRRVKKNTEKNQNNSMKVAEMYVLPFLNPLVACLH